MKKIGGIILVFVFFISSAFISPLLDKGLGKKENDPPFFKTSSTWADSVLQTMNVEEKIAQLLMVAAYSNKDEKHELEIEKLITENKIGGLIFMQGGPERQARLYNRYQKASKIPLMISIDGEWGLAMRLDSTVKYPYQMTLGAIQDEKLIYEMGVDIGEQCQRLGIQVNFAPVVDVNVNPKNPIINARSFGENKYNVAQKGVAYMKGMQSVNVLANAKHFPGHGDTDMDSHKSLPIINHDVNRMDSVELYPFKQLIENELASMMVAHLYIPAYENTPNVATTLSKNVVTNLLQDSLGFKGLIFTDALNMKGVSSFYKPGIVDVMALLAGNDVLLFSEDVPTAITEIKKAIDEGQISIEEINRRCLKILVAKEWAGLNTTKQVKLKNLTADLNKKEYELLNKKLFQKALTVLKNDSDLIPLKRLDTLSIASIAIGDGEFEDFQNSLELYSTIAKYNAKDITEDNFVSWEETLKNYNTVIVSFHNSDKNPWKKYRIEEKAQKLVGKLNETGNNVILVDFMNPYSLIGFSEAEQVTSLVAAYQNNNYTNHAVAELIYGGIGANGRLPVSVSEQFKEGAGLVIEPLGRFSYVASEEVGIPENDLYRIDSIANSGVKEGAYPGCQVFVAKDGKVIYNKSFGYHTYDSLIEVKNTDIYDLASITKVASTLLTVMQLQDQDKFSLDLNLCDYLSDLIPDTSDYGNLNLREILAHQSGLQAWVPFYLKTIRNKELDPVIYSSDSSNFYPYRVAKNIYINQHYPAIIYQRILKGPLKEKEYKYSDLGYYFLLKIAEKQTGKKLNDYVGNIYSQMGMSTTGYLPRNRFSLDRIPPTEDDKIFRKQIIHGDVHDPGAAMLGGVGGHAGLFSNANDLGKLMQMYVNKGMYGGERYIKDTTLNEFIKCQYCVDGNRRGAGFDKPITDGEGGPTCSCVSYLSFGHSGFTGTIAWADPVENIVYVFLSNRTFPDAENKKLLRMNIRTDIQQVVYDAINKNKVISSN